MPVRLKDSSEKMSDLEKKYTLQSAFSCIILNS